MSIAKELSDKIRWNRNRIRDKQKSIEERLVQIEELELEIKDAKTALIALGEPFVE